MKTEARDDQPLEVTGKVWVINKDDIDTDMIFHNRHLAITDPGEMAAHAFGNLEGYQDFAQKAGPGDIILTGKNFGAGSSRQQAVDCFMALGIAAVIANSFGAIYERNAINSAFPILTGIDLDHLEVKTGDQVSVNFEKGSMTLLKDNKTVPLNPFSEVQMEIYRNNGLF